jgi:hypothetical protein
LVTGRFPIEASGPKELLAKHQRRETTPLTNLRPDLPAEFVALVETALDPAPERRFPSAGAMERALLGLGASPAGSPSVTRGGDGFPRMAIVALVALGIAGAAIWVWSRRESARRSSPVAGGSAVGERSALGPPAGPPIPLAASAALMLDRGGRAIPLAPGDRVVPGDQLWLDYHGEEPAYLYVLDEDADGSVFVLFPASGLDSRNPLPGATTIRLPGKRAGEAEDWQVTSAGGRETIMVIASRDRLEALEQALAGFPAASPERPVAYGRLSRDVLRGVGGMAPAPAGAGPNGEGRLSRLYHGLVASVPRGGTWEWQIELESKVP